MILFILTLNSGCQSEVFAVAFALLAAGAVILTLNVLLLVISSLLNEPCLEDWPSLFGFYFHSLSDVNFVFICFLGRTHYFLPEFESSGLLFVPSGHWCIYLYVKGQCHCESSHGVHDIGLKLLGCISFHEFCC